MRSSDACTPWVMKFYCCRCICHCRSATSCFWVGAGVLAQEKRRYTGRLMIATQPNLLDFSSTSLTALMQAWGEPAFRATQLIQWLYQKGVTDIDQMSNI